MPGSLSRKQFDILSLLTEERTPLSQRQVEEKQVTRWEL